LLTVFDMAWIVFFLFGSVELIPGSKSYFLNLRCLTVDSKNLLSAQDDQQPFVGLSYLLIIRVLSKLTCKPLRIFTTARYQVLVWKGELRPCDVWLVSLHCCGECKHPGAIISWLDCESCGESLICGSDAGFKMC